MGRPRKEIKQKEFENLCGIQCTKLEICAFFDVTDKTLESWCKRTYHAGFSEVFSQKRGMGKISLRRKQWQLAEKSASMAIWLGKQYLNQRDNVDVTVSDAKGIALDELEKMVIGDDSGTGGETADGNTD
nr:MAG TPA: DNA-packaging protein small subunit [Caudoviricetes sp.]